jgi:hypothetical protein
MNIKKMNSSYTHLPVTKEETAYRSEVEMWSEVPGLFQLVTLPRP